MNQPPQHSSVPSLFLRGAIATLASGSLLAGGFTPARAALDESPKTVVDEVWQLVNQQYVDTDFNQDDWKATRLELLERQYSDRMAAYEAIRDALKKLGDPYTRFLDPEEFEDLTSQTSGELSGVGIRLEMNESTQKLTIVEPIPDSPAEAAGVESGDEIVAINGEPTALMELDEASALIRGELGTQVRLTLERQSEAFELVLTRAQIELPTVSYSLRLENNLRVGYIKLDEFSSHAAEQMRDAIEDLSRQDAQGYILDLRGNPGGLLFASIEIARMWMESGEIVYTVDRLGGDRHFSANNTAMTDLPLVVLVDGRSASASEILAGALKESARATIVGTRTYGKGTVQSVSSLSDGSGLAVTVSRYFPPSGLNISRQGIEPDIVTELSQEDRRRLIADPDARATTGRDPQYASAISVLVGDPVTRLTRSAATPIPTR
ncbi:C-terminal peptidase (prc) [Rubidibacter lacunae KORDI 51-2]|uniref:C-terminal peptidase (Prc) n=1 Tax=Rubidibacter lacunae KORDI 51-2 TaxID=582515 RepID=U5DN38_9CHRO|nr:carboxyl-terminal processing protease CtpB [Rubidibacter lacunae]ERN42272.1 C-terminal peptidase (prc) [Rubidibacter lacunae KORDI 51-2]